MVGHKALLFTQRNNRMNITDVTELPALVRGGGKKASEETLQLQTLLKTCTPKAIGDVEEGKAFNSLSQRIRTAAKTIGMTVEIRYRREEQTLYFQGKNKNTAI